MTRLRVSGALGRKYGKKLETPSAEVNGRRMKFEIRTKKEDGAYVFYCLHDYGDGEYEVLGPKEVVAGLVEEMVKKLKLDEHIEWKRFIYIKVTTGEKIESYRGRGWQSWTWASRDMALSFGVYEQAMRDGEPIFRHVKVNDLRDRPEVEDDFAFTPVEDVFESGPKTGFNKERIFRDSDTGEGVIPFSLEHWNKLLSILEAMEQMAEFVMHQLGGKDSDQIIKNLGNVEFPRLEAP